MSMTANLSHLKSPMASPVASPVASPFEGAGHSDESNFRDNPRYSSLGAGTYGEAFVFTDEKMAAERVVKVPHVSDSFWMISPLAQPRRTVRLLSLVSSHLRPVLLQKGERLYASMDLVEGARAATDFEVAWVMLKIYAETGRVFLDAGVSGNILMKSAPSGGVSADIVDVDQLVRRSSDVSESYLFPREGSPEPRQAFLETYLKEMLQNIIPIFKDPHVRFFSILEQPIPLYLKVLQMLIERDLLRDPGEELLSYSERMSLVFEIIRVLETSDREEAQNLDKYFRNLVRSTDSKSAPWVDKKIADRDLLASIPLMLDSRVCETDVCLTLQHALQNGRFRFLKEFINCQFREFYLNRGESPDKKAALQKLRMFVVLFALDIGISEEFKEIYDGFNSDQLREFLIKKCQESLESGFFYCLQILRKVSRYLGLGEIFPFTEAEARLFKNFLLKAVTREADVNLMPDAFDEAYWGIVKRFLMESLRKYYPELNAQEQIKDFLAAFKNNMLNNVVLTASQAEYCQAVWLMVSNNLSLTHGVAGPRAVHASNFDPMIVSEIKAELFQMGNAFFERKFSQGMCLNLFEAMHRYQTYLYSYGVLKERQKDFLLAAFRSYFPTLLSQFSFLLSDEKKGLLQDLGTELSKGSPHRGEMVSLVLYQIERIISKPEQGFRCFGATSNVLIKAAPLLTELRKVLEKIFELPLLEQKKVMTWAPEKLRKILEEGQLESSLPPCSFVFRSVREMQQVRERDKERTLTSSSLGGRTSASLSVDGGEASPRQAPSENLNDERSQARSSSPACGAGTGFLG